jgi:hypothetical protein
MRFVILRTALGLLLSAAGIQAIYTYVLGLDKGISFLILLLAIILICAGTYLLMKAGKSDETVFSKLKNFRRKRVDEDTVLEQALQTNNKLTEKWDQTIEKRDRLKMLEISTAAQAQAANE